MPALPLLQRGWVRSDWLPGLFMGWQDASYKLQAASDELQEASCRLQDAKL